MATSGDQDLAIDTARPLYRNRSSRHPRAVVTGEQREPTAPKPRHESIEVVAAWVLRARRIAAHSLCQDRGQLDKYATRFRITAYADGRLVGHRTLPDEERLESLAARIRPLMLPGERIFFKDVVEAVRRRVADLGHTMPQEDADRLDRIAASWAWHTIDDASGSRVLVEQGQPQTPGVVTFAATMAQLGGGWFYTDVAHNSPTGPRRVALEFPMAERFAAAVQMFAGLAGVVLDALNLIEDLDRRGYLELDPEVWISAVTVETGEVEQELSTAKFAPTGTPMPPIGGPAGPEWTTANLETLGRLAGQLHNLTARLLDQNEELLSSWPAVLHRPSDLNDGPYPALRLGNLVDVPLPDDPDDASAHEATLRFEIDHRCNETLLKQLELLRDLSWTRVIKVEGADGTVMAILRLHEGLGVTGLVELAAIEACRDLVTLEQLADVELPVLTELPSPDELVRWRILRLVLQGATTNAGPPALEVVSSNGQPPAVVKIEAHGEIVNGRTIPMPETIMWHPQITCAESDQPGIFRLAPPEGDLFRIWAPLLQQPDFDPHIATPAAWGLPWPTIG